jgi:putative transcriptional regulator
MHHVVPAFALATLAFAGQYAVPIGPVYPARRRCADPPAACRYQPKLDKGMLLVASKDLGDPNFSEAVILLIAYGANGTMGVIINRASNVKLASVLPKIKSLRKRGDVIYLGGPVVTNTVLLLIRSAKQPEDSLAILDDVYASSSIPALQHQLERKGSKEQLRAYVGHAGWAPGQLEAEVERGDWYVTPADADSVFTAAPEGLWRALLPRVEGDWVRRDEPGVCASGIG